MSTATAAVSNGTMIMFKGNESSTNACTAAKECIGFCLKDLANTTENAFCLALSKGATGTGTTNTVVNTLSFGMLFANSATTGAVVNAAENTVWNFLLPAFEGHGNW